MPLFPKFPDYSGVIFPIQVEPIDCSGEILTLIVVAIGQDGQVAHKTIINRRMVLSMFGVKGKYFLEVADLSLKSFLSHFEKTGTQVGWEPPLSNTKMGRVSQAMHDDIESMLQTGVETFSAFAASPNYL